MRHLWADDGVAMLETQALDRDRRSLRAPRLNQGDEHPQTNRQHCHYRQPLRSEVPVRASSDPARSLRVLRSTRERSTTNELASEPHPSLDQFTISESNVIKCEM